MKRTIPTTLLLATTFLAGFLLATARAALGAGFAVFADFAAAFGAAFFGWGRATAVVASLAVCDARGFGFAVDFFATGFAAGFGRATALAAFAGFPPLVCFG